MTPQQKPRKRRQKHPAKPAVKQAPPAAPVAPTEPSMEEVLSLLRASHDQLAHLSGIRDAAVAAMREREARVAQLVLLDTVIGRSQDLDSVRLVVDDVLRQAGVLRVTEPVDDPELFTAAPAGAAGAPTPAYVDEVTGRVLQRGTAPERREGE